MYEKVFITLEYGLGTTGMYLLMGALMKTRIIFINEFMTVPTSSGNILNCL